MAIIEKEYIIDLPHIGNKNLLTNHGILELLESIACYHSDLVHFGINEIDETGFTWVLLHWKVKVFKRVRYGDLVTVKTWAGYANKFYTLRDFEICDKNGDTICIASSKWVLVNAHSKSINKITDDVIGRYLAEPKSVFGENDIPKLKQPDSNAASNYIFKVQRKDIDVNKHMNNICYLDYSYEALPDSVYSMGEPNEFEIMYKTGALLGSEVNCYYAKENNSHFITMKSSDGSQLHAIAKFNF